MDKLPPIPTPASQRWREFRIQVLPLIIFIFVLCAVVLLWRNFVQPTGIVGEVESIKADVISLQDGLVVRLGVDRFEHVEAGQELGEISSSSDDFLKASIAAIEADLRIMDARIALDLQRNEQSFQQMNMEILQQRVELAKEKALLIQASNSFKRAEQEFNQAPKLISDNDYDIAKATFETLQGAVAERAKLVGDMNETLQKLHTPASPEDKDVVAEAIKTKIEELEASLKPMTLKAPMSGVISTIYHRAGEKVVRGVPILTITAPHSDRIVGYLRQPINRRPTTNDMVVVSTRTQKRQVGRAQIIRVGSQMELINPALLSTDSNRIEVGLPILVTLPDGLKLVPGEFVDLSIEYTKRQAD
jgi:multidrug resistance efflux pump